MKETEIRLIGLDLDDTTLASDGTLAAETKAAIRRAIDAGIEVVIASGRAYSALPAEVLEIPGIHYAVTSNGSAVNRVPGGQKIKSYVIPEKAVLQMLEIIEPYYGKLAVEAFIDGVPYSGAEHVAYPEKYGCSPAYVGYIRSTRKPVENIREFILENRNQINSMDVACPDVEIREKIRSQIAASMEGVFLTSSTKHLTEIICSDAGKDAGLKYVCDLLEIPHEATAACGNADNDIAMMKFAGLGVAVANATPNCLAAADLVIGNNNDHSIAEFINGICEKRK